MTGNARVTSHAWLLCSCLSCSSFLTSLILRPKYVRDTHDMMNAQCPHHDTGPGGWGGFRCRCFVRTGQHGWMRCSPAECSGSDHSPPDHLHLSSLDRLLCVCNKQVCTQPSELTCIFHFRPMKIHQWRLCAQLPAW